MSATSTKGKMHELYYTQSATLSTEHRFIHEYATVSLDSKDVEPNFNINEEVQPTKTKPVNEAKSKFENTLAHHSSRMSTDPKAQFEQTLKASADTKSKFDSCLQSESMKNDAKSKFDSAFENQLKSSNIPNASHGEVSLMPETSVTASVVGQILQQPTKRHHSAATKIQVGAYVYVSLLRPIPSERLRLQ